MPKLEPKAIQRELEQGLVWPVYWLYGQERMKARELLKRIRTTVHAEGASAGFGLGEETFDASETDAASIVDAAQSQALGGGTRVIIVRDAHALKNPEALAPLLGERAEKSRLFSVCVFLSKDLDGRKKFSKLLTEKAAVVPCEEVPEVEREAWVGYLAKRKGIELPSELVLRLRSMDPWTLDIIDQELEKLSLAGASGDALLRSVSSSGGADAFLEAFFSRTLKQALEEAQSFADRPDESLPLLGLLGWNVRHLALWMAERQNGTKSLKINPYVAEKLQRWSAKWKLSEVITLQQRLAQLDFGLKQTPLLPLGLWSSLVMEFCR